MSGTQPNIQVFVRYAQETAAHRDRCRALADRLRDDGIDAWIDQYVPAPLEGWPRWMQQQIVAAKFVILVCTPTFRRRFEGNEAPGVGNGATWEGLIANQMLHDTGALNEKLVPVLFEDSTLEDGRCRATDRPERLRIRRGVTRPSLNFGPTLGHPDHF